MSGGGMMTHSGERVGMHHGVPTIEDIALALSRIPRFGGHCRVNWTVLNHSLVCERIARNDGRDRLTRLACLLHDAHEAVTGDVPTPLKVPQMKVLQQVLDNRIMDAYFHRDGRFAYSVYADLVGPIDRRALLAEAVTVGPPKINNANVLELFGGVALLEDVAVVKTEAAMSKAVGCNVDAFLFLYTELTK